MSQDRRSRKRWKIDQSRASGMTKERWKGTNSSSENEATDPPRGRSASSGKNRRASGWSIRNIKQPNKNVSDDSGEEVLGIIEKLEKSSTSQFGKNRRKSGSSIKNISQVTKNISDDSGNEIEPEVLGTVENVPQRSGDRFEKNIKISESEIKSSKRDSKNVSNESEKKIEPEISVLLENLRRSGTFTFRRDRTKSGSSIKSSRQPDKKKSDESGTEVGPEVSEFVEDLPKSSSSSSRKTHTISGSSFKSKVPKKNTSDESENGIEAKDSSFVAELPKSSSSSSRRTHTISGSFIRSNKIIKQNTSDESGNEVEPKIPVLLENPPRRNGTPFRRNRTTSESSRDSRQPCQNITDESETEGESVTLGKLERGFAKYNTDFSKNDIESPVDSSRNVEKFLMGDYARSTDNKEIISSDNDFGRREKRRKSKRERKEQQRQLGSNRTEEEDAYDEEAPSSDLTRPKSTKGRRDGSRKSKRRKKSRSRRDSSVKSEKQENELPITEILRKAQENTKTRYEEPLPLAELTTDTVYVQGRNGFSAIKISGDLSTGFLGRRKSKSREPTMCPIKVSIFAQKVWNGTGLIHQGLLAGMAFMHFLLIQTFFKFSFDELVDYSLISEIYTNIFSYLVTMCVVSTFDKFDVAHVSLEHLREIYVDHSRSLLAIPLYIVTFGLHQANHLIDDRISSLRYEKNFTDHEYNSTSISVEDDFVTWQRITLAKDGLAFFAWLFVVLGPREDMLLTHLKSMAKYADVANVSK